MYRKIAGPSFLLLFLAVTAMLVAGCRKDNCKNGIEEKIYVANEEGGSVTVIDAETFKVLRTVELEYKKEMYMPHNVQVAPDNGSVWVTGAQMHDEHADEMLFVLKGKRDKDKEHINVGSGHHLAHVVLDDESKFAYATGNESGKVVKVDVEKMKEVEGFDLGVGSGPHGLRYMNGKLYVACMTSQEMAIIDIATGSISRLFLGGIAVQTAVLPGPGSVFVSVYDLKEVVRYDIATGDTVRIALPAGAQGPIQLYPSRDNQRLYVCDQGIVNGNPSSNQIYVIDVSTNTVIAAITVGNGAHGVVTSLDGTKVFVTNTLDNTVSVIDALSLSVISTVTVGEAPNGISVLECDCE